MRFEPEEKPNKDKKDNSICFCLRSSAIPILADFLLSCVMGFLCFVLDYSTRTGRSLMIFAFGLWLIAFVGFTRAVIARISTLVFVTKYRLYGQIYAFLPSHRQIEISLEEIENIEVRATLGTRVFRYAHLILHPYNGKKIKLPAIRNAETLAVILLKMQEKLTKEKP